MPLFSAEQTLQEKILKIYSLVYTHVKTLNKCTSTIK